jgi:hypothetical protein
VPINYNNNNVVLHSLPGLSFDAMLLYSGVTIDLLETVDFANFFEVTNNVRRNPLYSITVRIMTAEQHKGGDLFYWTSICRKI